MNGFVFTPKVWRHLHTVQCLNGRCRCRPANRLLPLCGHPAVARFCYGIISVWLTVIVHIRDHALHFQKNGRGHETVMDLRMPSHRTAAVVFVTVALGLLIFLLEAQQTHTNVHRVNNVATAHAASCAAPQWPAQLITIQGFMTSRVQNIVQ